MYPVQPGPPMAYWVRAPVPAAQVFVAMSPAAAGPPMACREAAPAAEEWVYGAAASTGCVESPGTERALALPVSIPRAAAASVGVYTVKTPPAGAMEWKATTR